MRKKKSSYLNYESNSDEASEEITEENTDNSKITNNASELLTKDKYVDTHKDENINQDVTKLMSELVTSAEERSCSKKISHYSKKKNSRNVKSKSKLLSFIF